MRHESSCFKKLFINICDGLCINLTCCFFSGGGNVGTKDSSSSFNLEDSLSELQALVELVGAKHIDGCGGEEKRWCAV